VGIKESGKGLVSSKDSMIFPKNIDNEQKDISIYEMYRNAYLRVPIVAAAIDTITSQTVQEFFFESADTDFTLQGPPPVTKTVVKKRKVSAIERFADEQNLQVFFNRVVKNMLIYGNSYVEVVSKGRRIEELKILDPITMDVVRKATGKVIAYIQRAGTTEIVWGDMNAKGVGSRAKKVGSVKDIVHFKFNVIGSDKYGTSLIHRVLPIVDTKLDIERDMNVLIQRYVTPIIHAMVGDDNHPASQSDVDSVTAKLEDIYADTEYVTSHLVKMNVLGFQGKALPLEPLFSHVDMQIMTGMLVPPVLLGRSEGADRAIAEVQLRNFGRTINAIQRVLKVEFEDKIIKNFFGGGVKLIWGTADERESQIDIDMIRGLTTDGIITAQKANSLLPPKFHEKLPDLPPPTPRPTQSNKSAPTDTDPTMTTLDKGRAKKTDLKSPLDDVGAKGNQPRVVQKRGVK